MTDEEKILFKRKWKFTNEFKRFGNAMFTFHGFGVLDFRKEGILILEDSEQELQYTLVDRFLEISLPVNRKNVLRLRIGELTPDMLTIGVSGKRGDETGGKFRAEMVELIYAPLEE